MRAFIDGVRVPINRTMSTRPIGVGSQIPEGGQLVLGQSMKYGRRSDEILQQPLSGDQSMFEELLGFIGELGFVNVWRSALTSSDISMLHTDCNLIYCGDVIEWADFRNGRTRGWLRVVWPSRIFTEEKVHTSSKNTFSTNKTKDRGSMNYILYHNDILCIVW